MEVIFVVVLTLNKNADERVMSREMDVNMYKNTMGLNYYEYDDRVAHSPTH